MIVDTDISVVVQGPVRSNTANCLASVRRALPGADIILSTWTGEDINGLTYDKIIQSEAPPSYAQHIRSGILNNLNKLIRSTKAGVEIAKRPYLLKIRSDLILSDNRFLTTFSKFPARGPRSVFKHKIIVPLIYSRTGYRGFRTPFHLSDWAAFGLTQDLRNLYLHTSEVDDPSFTQFFLGRETETPYGPTLLKMAPEQYQILSAFRHYYDDVNMNDCSTVSKEVSLASDEFIVSNFIISPYSGTGWKVPKYSQSAHEFDEGESYFELWTPFVYETAYKKFCNPNYLYTEMDDIARFKRRNTYESLFRLRKHFRHLLHSKQNSKRIEQLFTIPFFTVLLLINILCCAIHSNPNKNTNRFKPFGKFK